MREVLKILMVAAECAPYAKTGGLGDVTGALPRFLRKKGHDIRVVMPFYSSINRDFSEITLVTEGMEVSMGFDKISCDVYMTMMTDDVPLYLIYYKPFFDRENLYHDNYFNDYADNAGRFAFLSRASLEWCRKLGFAPDIVHANDWHTALLPAYLRHIYNNDPLFKTTGTLLTIHNLAYQGRYDRYYFYYAGLDEQYFTPEIFECHYAVNFLKGGIHFADIINTVSRGYAAETRSAGGGFGLESFLAARGDEYVGILNGVDYDQWNPATDMLIPAKYSSADLSGKKRCKRVLQEMSGFIADEHVPVTGIIGRLVEQKGFYILAGSIEDMLKSMDVQFVMLGTGNRDLEMFYSELQKRYPGRLRVTVAYDNAMAHLIEAGSDLFLMPSLYEPCGLNQIYSMKYGTLPVVRATGGLNDTVENYNMDSGRGTGFMFSNPDSRAIYNTMAWALDTWRNRKRDFSRMVQNAMNKNFSWEKSVDEYIGLYRKIMRKKSEGK